MNENETTEYEYRGKHMRITYVSRRGYYIISIDNQLLSQIFKTELEAIQEAFRMISSERLGF